MGKPTRRRHTSDLKNRLSFYLFHYYLCCHCSDLSRLSDANSKESVLKNCELFCCPVKKKKKKRVLLTFCVFWSDVGVILDISVVVVVVV